MPLDLTTEQICEAVGEYLSSLAVEGDVTDLRPKYNALGQRVGFRARWQDGEAIPQTAATPPRL